MPVWIGRARRLKLRPLFGALCEVLVIIHDLKCHLLGYFVLHIMARLRASSARLRQCSGSLIRQAGTKFPSRDRRRSLALRLHDFTPLIKLTTIQRREFVAGNRRLADSVSIPTRRIGKRRAGTCVSTVERGHPHGPAITLSHRTSNLG